MTNTYTAHIGGENRVFTFGVWAHKIYQDRFSKEVDNMFNAMLCVIYAGLVANSEKNNLPPNFDLRTVSEWVEEMEPSEYDRIVKIGMQSFMTDASKKMKPLVEAIQGAMQTPEAESIQ